MSKKVIIETPEREEIIELLKTGYQITVSEIQKLYPQFSYHVIRSNIVEWGLSDLLFRGCKDSTKQKLSNFNSGKTLSEDTKRKIGIGTKKAAKNRTKQSWEESWEKAKSTIIQNVGSIEESYRQRQLKTKQTKEARYGDPNYNNIAKNKQTTFERYGDENYNNRQQQKQTCMQKYGGVGCASPELKQKYQNTMLERYGVAHNWSSDDPVLNGRKTMFENAGSKEQHYQNILQKGKETRLKLYGDEFYSNSEQAQKTMLERYGCRYYVTTPDCREACANIETAIKRYETMRKNGTFKKSKEEDDFYLFLREQFGQEDVIRWHSEERYPFKCDFYIPSKDLFIECHFGWRHMGHAFREDNEDDQQLLEKLRKKALFSDNYKNAIYQWTDLDPRKVSVARENNVNLIVIYNEDEYYDYDI